MKMVGVARGVFRGVFMARGVFDVHNVTIIMMVALRVCGADV